MHCSPARKIKTVKSDNIKFFYFKYTFKIKLSINECKKEKQCFWYVFEQK